MRVGQQKSHYLLRPVTTLSQGQTHEIVAFYVACHGNGAECAIVTVRVSSGRHALRLTELHFYAVDPYCARATTLEKSFCFSQSRIHVGSFNCAHPCIAIRLCAVVDSRVISHFIHSN